MQLIASCRLSMLALAGVTLIGIAPAFAGADDGKTKAFWQAEAAPAQSRATDQNSRYTASHQTYMNMDPRDAKAAPSQNVDGSNIYFNHAKGTMSGN